MKDFKKIFEKEVKKFSFFQVCLLVVVLILVSIIKIFFFSECKIDAFELYFFSVYSFVLSLIGFGVYARFGRSLWNRLPVFRRYFRMISLLLSMLILLVGSLYWAKEPMWFSTQFLVFYVAEFLFDIIYYPYLRRKLQQNS